MDALEAMLAASRARFERVMIVSEGLYSMDGDGPDLARLVEIKDRHESWLMVDDAHALGVLGHHRTRHLRDGRRGSRPAWISGSARCRKPW